MKSSSKQNTASMLTSLTGSTTQASNSLPQSPITQANENKNSEEKEDDFSYPRINQILSNKKPPSHIFQEYVAMMQGLNKNFIFFMPREENTKTPCAEGKVFALLGLKFHISLVETDKDLFLKGWDITRKILLNEKLTFKVVRDGIKMSATKGQEGKDITIYADYNPEKNTNDWHRILLQITEQLVAANVPPGYRPSGSKEKPEGVISGSNYLTYRYFDESQQQKRLTQEAKDEILVIVDGVNELGWPNNDPISQIKISTAKAQLPIPEIKALTPEQTQTLGPKK